VSRWCPRGGVVRAAALLVAALLGAGCAQEPVPPDLNYRLLHAADAVPRAEPVLDGTLMVARFRADGVLAERPLAWVGAAAPRALRQHHYHFWNSPPPQMLQDFAAEVLRARGVAARVLVAGAGVEADFAIAGRVRHLEQTVGGEGEVVVSLELALYREEPRRLLLLQRYDVRLAPAAPGIDAAVAAINDAVLTILDRFVADLGAR